MSTTSRSPSPPLPTFAIKDLCGPANPPALISISKRRYDATLKSAPGAALLYLDDDDGELITVGSSFELNQRLEEPVPKYIRELRDPADGKLVHVFDINHSAANLSEWRDHEAYSSKRYNALSSPFHSPRADSVSSPIRSYPSDQFIVSAKLPEPQAESSTSSDKAEAAVTEVVSGEQKGGADIPFRFLDGIEEHLSGLANVLQIASDTLRRAAEKTNDADTSLVEDILKGVKGILTEVGSFGVEAFKELSDEITSDRVQAQPTQPVVEAAAVDEKEATAQDNESAEEATSESTNEASQSSDETLQASVYYNVENDPTEDTFTKVKFASPEVLPQEPDSFHSARFIPIHARSARPEDSCRVNFVPSTTSIKPQNGSILDDSSEDAEFTARYPPLSTIRRVRSTVERPARWSTNSEERLRDRVRHGRTVLAEREATKEKCQSQFMTACSPFTSPPPTRFLLDGGVMGRPGPVDEMERNDVVQKPLPGAWPDVKNDAGPAQPVPRESSGDFFNRMVGRGRSERSKGFAAHHGLHRANTTASSNPASRLNGPFDPGFPYDASQDSRRLGRLPPYRPYRRSASPRRQSPVRPSRPDKRSFVVADVPSYPIRGPSAIRARAADPRRTEANSLVKHHRSVPQLRDSPSLPYQIMKSKPVGNDAIRPIQPSTTDFLSGPPLMPMQPPMPFTARPIFAPRSVPPNLWAPWQSSPPTQAPADENTNVSAINEFPSRKDVESPVSPQSTVTHDFELPSNEPPFPSAQPPRQSPSLAHRYPTPPGSMALPPHFATTGFPVLSRHPPPRPPPPPQCMRLEPVRDKIDECVEQLKMCGFGVDDENMKNRLHVYAVAADGDVMEAVEMIEQDRRMTAPGRFN